MPDFSLFNFGFQRGGRGGNGLSKNQIGTRGSDKVTTSICILYVITSSFLVYVVYHLLYLYVTDRTSTNRHSDSSGRRGATFSHSK